MIDKDKIILMTKLALYEKKHGLADSHINHFFLSDYVYLKNSWTRFCVFLGCIILLAVDWMHKILNLQTDIFGLDIKAELIDNLTFIAVVLAAYTIIGTQRAIVEYNAAQRRISQFLDLLSRLNGDTKGNGRLNNAKEAIDGGADFDHPRNSG